MTKDFINIDPTTLFKILYNYSKPIKKWIKQNNGNNADAEDVLQDAMIAFYQMIHKPNFILTAKPETLLFGISKKIWLNQLRKNKKILLIDNFKQEDCIEINEDFLEEELKYKSLEKTLTLIGDKCLQLLNLFYFEKKEMIEIAKILDFRNDKVAKAMKYKCLEKARVLIHTKK